MTKAKKDLTIISIVLLILSILVWFFGVRTYLRMIDVRENFHEGIATVTNVSTISSGDKYRVTFIYSVDDNPHQGIIDMNSNPGIGGKLNIVFNPEQPSEVYLRSNIFVTPYILFGVGLLLSLAWFGLAKSISKYHTPTHVLKTSGDKKLAEAVSHYRDMSFSVNHVNPIVLVCHVRMNKETRELKSGYFWDDPNMTNETYVVDVYFHPKNIKKYFVDVDSLRVADEYEKATIQAHETIFDIDF